RSPWRGANLWLPRVRVSTPHQVRALRRLDRGMSRQGTARFRSSGGGALLQRKWRTPGRITRRSSSLLVGPSSSYSTPAGRISRRAGTSRDGRARKRALVTGSCLARRGSRGDSRFERATHAVRSLALDRNWNATARLAADEGKRGGQVLPHCVRCCRAVLD